MFQTIKWKIPTLAILALLGLIPVSRPAEQIILHSFLIFSSCSLYKKKMKNRHKLKTSQPVPMKVRGRCLGLKLTGVAMFLAFLKKKQKKKHSTATLLFCTKSSSKWVRNLDNFTSVQLGGRLDKLKISLRRKLFALDRLKTVFHCQKRLLEIQTY